MHLGLEFIMQQVTCNCLLHF